MLRLAALGRVLPFGFGGRRSLLLIERNILVYKNGWLVILSGFFEPLFYLLSIGLGIGGIVGDLPGPNGTTIPYALFVAPALLASASMNGAIGTVPPSVRSRTGGRERAGSRGATVRREREVARGRRCRRA